MPTPKAGWVPVQLNCDLATDTITYGCPGITGTVKQITVAIPTLPTSGVLDVYKNAEKLCTQINMATTVVAGVAEDATLVTTVKVLRIAATDVLSANWNVGTAGSYVGGGCTVWIEPDTW